MCNCLYFSYYVCVGISVLQHAKALLTADLFILNIGHSPSSSGMFRVSVISLNLTAIIRWG